jgi:hypothetical protein
MREMMTGDHSKKLSEGVESLDFKVLDCNCRLQRRKRTRQVSVQELLQNADHHLQNYL